MTDPLKTFAQAQEQQIYNTGEYAMSPDSAPAPQQEGDSVYVEKENEFNQAIIKFQKTFKGLKYDQDMKISEHIKFRYVSHAQLISMVSKPLAECGLGHYSNQTLKDGILKVRVTLFHKNGYSKSSYYEFPFDGTIFSSGLKNACTRYQYNNNKVEKVSCMTYMHELAKAGALASKYALQALLGIAGGEIDEQEEQAEQEIKPVNYDNVMERIVKHATEKNIGVVSVMERITKNPEKSGKERLDELRKYIKQNKEVK